MENSMKMKKNDLILIIVVIIIAAAAFLIHNFMGGKHAGVVTVKVDGELEGTYSLHENQEIEINGGSNILVIKDGEADMTWADCPDKLCVKQKSVSKKNENIICLPNKVIVEVESDESSEYDAVTN